jgi:hypothetical protein
MLAERLKDSCPARTGGWRGLSGGFCPHLKTHRSQGTAAQGGHRRPAATVQEH